MTDAALSDAKETIAIVNSTAIERESDAPVTANVEEIPALSHAENDQADVAIDVSSSPCLPASDDTLLIEKCRKNSIPTAIVKPKYQRQSYDDRQLPPVVCIDREKPWYHNSTTTAITSSNNNNQQQQHHINNNVIVVGSSTTQPKKIQQLPHFERKHKKILPIRNAVGGGVAKGLVSEKEKFNSLRLCEKDIDSSSVAIVPPRKKESIVMEKQQQQQQHQQTAKATASPPASSTPTNIYVNEGGTDVVDYTDDDKRINNCSIQKNMANISNNNNSSKCGNNNNKNNNNHHHHQRPLHHHPLHNYVRGSTKTATMPTIPAGGAGASTATTSSITISRKVLPEKREKLSTTSIQQTARHTKDISGESIYTQRIYYININYCMRFTYFPIVADDADGNAFQTIIYSA